MALPKDNVTIFGIGRLGICTALVLEQQGKYNVVGVDTNEKAMSKPSGTNRSAPLSP